jgi:hypothetical protein
MSVSRTHNRTAHEQAAPRCWFSLSDAVWILSFLAVFLLCFRLSAKKISDMWKNVSASDKAKFDKAAAEDKKRYEREMADYNQRGGAAASAAPAKKAKSQSCTWKGQRGKEKMEGDKHMRPWPLLVSDFF